MTTLAEKITALENIAILDRNYDAAVANGDVEMQRLLLKTITARTNDLDKLYVEKGGNQSAFVRGKRGTQFSSII